MQVCLQSNLETSISLLGPTSLVVILFMVLVKGRLIFDSLQGWLSIAFWKTLNYHYFCRGSNCGDTYALWNADVPTIPENFNLCKCVISMLN